MRALLALCLVLPQVAHAEVGGNWMGGGRNSLLYGYAQPVPAAGCFSASGAVLTLDASDLTTLYTDVAGTTNVTADGDPVGMWKDKNGNGFDLTALGDDGTRPTYHTSGGLHWVSFDGNDVLRRTANLGLYSGGAMTIGVAVKETTNQQSSIAGEGLSSDSNPYYDPLRHSAASPTNAFITSRANGGTFELNGQNYYTNGFTTNTDLTLIVTDSGSSITGYLDGATGTTTGYSRSTHANADRFWLGARIRASTDSYFIGNVYFLRAYGRVLNSTEIANDNTCLKATQGR